MKPSNARTSGKGGVSFTRVEDYWVIVEEGCWVANIWRVSAGYERARVVQSIWWDVRVTEPPAKFYKFLLGRFNPTFRVSNGIDHVSRLSVSYLVFFLSTT